MDRRNFIKVGGALAGGLGLGRLLPAQQAPQMPQMQGQGQNQNSGGPQTPADFTLKIAPVLVELAPYRSLSTIGYNGTSPGPLIRVREGKPVTIDVVNDTDTPELFMDFQGHRFFRRHTFTDFNLFSVEIDQQISDPRGYNPE